MLFKGVPASELSQWSTAIARGTGSLDVDWQDVVGVNPERALDASLFRVLEWGGMEILGR